MTSWKKKKRNPVKRIIINYDFHCTLIDSVYTDHFLKSKLKYSWQIEGSTNAWIYSYIKIKWRDAWGTRRGGGGYPANLFIFSFISYKNVFIFLLTMQNQKNLNFFLFYSKSPMFSITTTFFWGAIEKIKTFIWSLNVMGV